MKKFLHQVSQLFQKKEQHTVPFKVLFADFKKSLELNNQILDLIADANDKLSGDYVYDEQYIHTICRQLSGLVRELIVIIDHLTGQKYPALFTSFHDIEEEIAAILKGTILCPVNEYILPYTAVSRDIIDAVGGKNAHLAEIGSLLDLQIPAGFAITTAAFSAFWEENNLEESVTLIKRQWQLGDLSLEDAARNIRQAIDHSCRGCRLPWQESSAGRQRPSVPRRSGSPYGADIPWPLDCRGWQQPADRRQAVPEPE